MHDGIHMTRSKVKVKVTSPWKSEIRPFSKAGVRRLLPQTLNYLLNYLLAFRPLLSTAVRLPRIYNNKLKFSRLWVFVLPLLYQWRILRHRLTLTGQPCGAATWRTRQNIRVVSSLILAHSLHYLKTWRRTQNRQYSNVRYRIADREDRATATNNM